MASPVVVETPCKVNLHLGVHHQKDARGYHRVDSVMVPVALTDTVEARPARGLSVRFEPALEVPVEKTGVWRAATLLAEALGVAPDVELRVRARIPVRAGLGGSSADAGAALRALCELWGVDALDERVVGVARRVGADVAFFLRPEPALFLGAGDVFERAFPALDAYLALVMPSSGGGSTPQAYAEFDRSGIDPAPYGGMCAALEGGDVAVVAARLHNNLADAARALCPEVAVVEGWLRAQPGVLAAQVTGSGSCSFALCEGERAACEVAERAASERGWRSWATKTWTY
ncbi:4-(cytidine 5'-diphospho)-2-C-methyl-D-erythritol kinase [Olsenella profusa]|uniref:4-diphosphocytidyl-2-C-methyl-D-erythritol kinase n=1 Tax=Olsenella profusa TaxID=138595 RepID=A0ABS2F3L4_9ACTN|nr:4-diphosphocytidyl-2C-methyl-D-erythritol kinase [Olsenella profusa]MBM6775402.1 4-diphosphocytidyl-2C-methyl-D-erythritol kinase [Olsenella profusa]